MVEPAFVTLRVDAARPFPAEANMALRTGGWTPTSRSALRARYGHSILRFTDRAHEKPFDLASENEKLRTRTHVASPTRRALQSS
jgi:hypothetical protein